MSTPNLAIDNTVTPFDKKAFYKKFFKLAIPISAQQLVSMSLNFIDNIMIGVLGTVAIAAVGFANQIFFIYILFLVGLFSAATTYMAQYFGRKDYSTLQKIFGSFGVIIIILSIIFTLILLIFSNSIMKIFSVDSLVIREGSIYLFISATFYPFFAFSFIMAQSLRSVGLTQYSLYLTIIVALTNTLLNYMLIYGNWGAPRLEVTGAAIATVIARLVEFIGFVAVFWHKDLIFRTKFKNYFGLPKTVFKSIVNKTKAIFLQEVVWVVGSTLILIAYSKTGTDYIAIITISNIIIDIGVVLFLGISSTTSILIAHSLGANDIANAKKISQESIKLSLFMGFAVSVMGFLIIAPVLSIYSIPEYTINTAIIILCTAAFTLSFQLMNWLLIVGILRAGGDATIPLLIDLLPKFLYAVPIAFIAILYFKFPIYVAVILVDLEEIIKIFFAIKRYRGFKWINNLTTSNKYKENDFI